MRKKNKRICEYCKEIFYISENRIKWGRGKYCSKKCKYKGMKQDKSKKIKCQCAVCRKIFYRSPSQIISQYQFCSKKCKAIGMSKKLVAPMRLGTGCPDKHKYYKRKYYKYRQFDKKNKHEIIDCDVWEFVSLMENSKCIYCDDTKELGLDRIDNNRGHILSNTVVCCATCNMTRGDRFSVNEMKKIGRVIFDIKKSRVL